MSKWGVPFNVDLDLVGKAWKTVEKNIDKAIGMFYKSLQSLSLLFIFPFSYITFPSTFFP